jgi:hypothetical protein
MTYNLNISKIKLLGIIFCVMSILPFVLISFYIHPHYDDYDFVNKLVGKNVFECTVYWYNTWSGRYSSIFLSNILTYGTENIFVYRLFPLILMGLYIIAFYTLLKTLFGNILGKLKLIFLSLFLLILYLYKMPEVTSGFYYMICSYVSSIGTIALIFLLSVLIKLLDKNIKSRNYYIFLGCFLAFFIGGSYEPVMVMSLAFLFLVGIFMLLKKNLNFKWIALIGIILFLSSVLSIIGHGNKIRGGENLLKDNHASLPLVFLRSAISGCNLFIYTIQNPLLITSLILFIPFAIIINKNNSVINSVLNMHPAVPAIGIIFITIISFVPTVWSANGTPPRVLNQIYLFIILNLFLFIQVLVNFCIRNKIEISFSKSIHSIIKIVFLLCLIPSLTNKNIGRAYSDLFSKAPLYSKKMSERYEYIKEQKAKGEKNITLPQLFENYKSYPLTIYYNYQELEDRYNSSVNKIYAKYWKLDSVKVNSTNITEEINKLRVN